jgi:hypothetical protein
MSFWKRVTSLVTSPTFKFQGAKERLQANKQRHIQEQLDVFNLYLYTALHRHAGAGAAPEHVAKEISAEVGAAAAADAGAEPARSSTPPSTPSPQARCERLSLPCLAHRRRCSWSTLRAPPRCRRR